MRLRRTSEMATLAAMCMMAVERARGGYTRALVSCDSCAGNRVDWPRQQPLCYNL